MIWSRSPAGWPLPSVALRRRGIGLVGVNDLIKRNREHATHFLTTRAYASEPTIDGQPGPCCTVYAHWKIDDELIATAKARDAYVYAPDAHVRHLHHINDLAPDDDTYRKGREHRGRTSESFSHGRGYGRHNSTHRFTIGSSHLRQPILARSWPSGGRFLPLRVREFRCIQFHGKGTLAQARNEIIARTNTEFLILLDADDELEPGYVAAMARGSADIRVPRVRKLCVTSARRCRA